MDLGKKKAKGGKKGRKIGRNKKFCDLYALENRRMRNKVRRKARHMKRHPKDLQSKAA